jgi:hypothetical protein
MHRHGGGCIFFLRSQQRFDSSALFVGLDPEFPVAST